MKLNSPKKNVFYVSVALVVVGLLGYFVDDLASYQTLSFLLGYLLLAAGNLLKGF